MTKTSTPSILVQPGSSVGNVLRLCYNCGKKKRLRYFPLLAPLDLDDYRRSELCGTCAPKAKRRETRILDVQPRPRAGGKKRRNKLQQRRDEAGRWR